MHIFLHSIVLITAFEQAHSKHRARANLMENKEEQRVPEVSMHRPDYLLLETSWQNSQATIFATLETLRRQTCHHQETYLLRALLVVVVSDRGWKKGLYSLGW